MDVITYPCRDLSQTMLVKGATGFSWLIPMTISITLDIYGNTLIISLAIEYKYDM